MTALETPQWQGSSSPRARLLKDGAARLAAHLPSARRVPVADHTSAESGGVHSLEVLRDNLSATRTALDTSPTIVVGGDCGIELAPIERASRVHGDQLTVVWFDAHGDLNTPETSPSHAFHGMVLRTLLGDGPSELLPTHPLRPDQIVLAGARALDPGEQEFIEAHDIRHIPSSALETLPEWIHTPTVYFHIDLDVLDPTTFTSLGFPEPNGTTPDTLLTTVQAIATHHTIAGLGITEYQPTAPSDEQTLATLVPALASAIR
jgi:arginase